MIRKVVATFYLSLALAGALPAAAEATHVHAVRDALNAAGLKGTRIGILSGQPMVSGDLQGIGTVAALRRCSPPGDNRRMCEEVSFKACIQLQPAVSRESLLAAANEYNLQRYAGTMVIDDNNLLGDMACVMLHIDLRDENEFDMHEVYHWTQALTDFRSYLIDAEVPVLNPDQL